MSDRLAVSASMSVLMMAIYVLFGANTARVPLELDESFTTPAGISAPGLAPSLANEPGRLLSISR